ncbi:MAG: tripartite tricarboxylate transporter TctB family protein, partial [Thermohalobaculum sp.]
MRLAELVTAIVLAILSIYMMWKSGQPAWEGDPRFQNIWFVEGEGPGSGFWPFWLSGVMLLCCVWIAVNWVRRASPPSRSKEKYLDAYGMLMLLRVGGGVTVFIGLVHFIGMYFAMMVF